MQNTINADFAHEMASLVLSIAKMLVDDKERIEVEIFTDRMAATIILRVSPDDVG